MGLKNMKTGTIIKLVFFGFGSVWIIFGLVFYLNLKRFTEKSQEAMGTVLELKRVERSSTTGGTRSITYYPVVRYQAPGGRQVTFTSLSGSYPSPYRRGDRIPILFDPRNPQNARIKSFSSLWLAPVVGLGVGGLLFIIGTVVLTWRRISKGRREWFERNGKTITAEVTRIDINRKMKVNGKNPCKIYAHHADPFTREMLTYQCKLWIDPQEEVNKDNIPTLEIRVDPQNYKRYFINMDTLKDKPDGL